MTETDETFAADDPRRPWDDEDWRARDDDYKSMPPEKRAEMRSVDADLLAMSKRRRARSKTTVTLTTAGGEEFIAILSGSSGDEAGSFSYKGGDDTFRLADVTASQLEYSKDAAAGCPNGYEAKFLAVHAALTERRETARAALTTSSEDRITADTHKRLAATEQFHELRAQERMEAHDAAFDTWDDLDPMWDEPPLMPEVGAMTNGVCLFYKGFRNGLFGPSESGKTIMAAHLVVQEISAGRPVVYLDYENGGHAFTGLLRAFGATREAVSLVRYKWMDGGPVPSADKAAKLAAALVADGGQLAVLDTVSPAMAALGLDQFSNPDVERFYALAMDAWADAGCAPVVLDHTPNADPFKAYGAERKRSGIYGMSLNLIPKVPFSRYEAGYSNVYINKDRHGALSYVLEDGRRLAAQLHITPDWAALAVGSADGKGTVEIRPMDVDALKIEHAAAAALKEMSNAAARDERRRQIVDWFNAHDPKRSGLTKTWISSGQRGNVEPGRLRIQPLGGKTTDILREVEQMTDEGLIVVAEKGITLSADPITSAELTARPEEAS